jgi:hypothetical protein
MEHPIMVAKPVKRTQELTLDELHAVAGGGNKLQAIYNQLNEYSQTLQSQDKLGNTQIQTF